MFSACLTCKQARKPKECGAGYAYCLLTRKYVEVMALCPDFSHIAQKTPAVVGSAPVLSGSGNSQAGVLPVVEQQNINGRLNLANCEQFASAKSSADVPPPYNNRGTRDKLSFTGPNISHCGMSQVQENV